MKLTAFSVMFLAASTLAAQILPAKQQLVSFAGPAGTLQGYLYVPEGKGPFPAVLWNHGSEKLPGDQPDLAAFYTSNGFVFFLPHRRGHGRSPGTYIVDEIQESHSPAAAVQLQEAANGDVVAAMMWLRARKDVDANRIIISGCSFGGIQTLLAAEKGLGARGFVAFAPAAKSWGNGMLQERLERAVQDAKGPVFILQAKNDFSLGPSKDLGRIAKAHGGRAEIYPEFGKNSQDGHWSFATSKAGIDVWQKDILEFIRSSFK